MNSPPRLFSLFCTVEETINVGSCAFGVLICPGVCVRSFSSGHIHESMGCIWVAKQNVKKLVSMQGLYFCPPTLATHVCICFFFVLFGTLLIRSFLFDAPPSPPFSPALGVRFLRSCDGDRLPLSRQKLDAGRGKIQFLQFLASRLPSRKMRRTR